MTVLVLAVVSPGARGVMVEAGRVIAALLSTPFVLEPAFFVIGCALLYLHLARRKRREGDEWVYAVAGEDGELEVLGEAASRRLGELAHELDDEVWRESRAGVLARALWEDGRVAEVRAFLLALGQDERGGSGVEEVVRRCGQGEGGEQFLREFMGGAEGT